jgi:LL-diaminopimelate aminotransferase
VAERARLIWVCHPHAPTGRCLSRQELANIYEWAARREIAVASDEAYTDFYYDREPPPSMLEVAREGVIAFFSLSKRSAMTGYRIGFAAGDSRLVGLLRSVKTNIDSGTPWFVEEAAIAALGDEEHVVAMRQAYARNRDILCDALAKAGLARSAPQGTIYVWQRVPEGMTSVDFALRLLEPPLAIVVTPGPWLAEPLADGTNPGEGFVRFALVPPEGAVRRAAERIASLSF